MAEASEFLNTEDGTTQIVVTIKRRETGKGQLQAAFDVASGRVDIGGDAELATPLFLEVVFRMTNLSLEAFRKDRNIQR